MKLRTQIIAFGLAGASAAALVGGLGLFASTGLGGAIDSAILSSQALQASQEADMMHDAVRGDGQLALFGALQNSPERIEEAAKGLNDHAKTFNDALARLDALPLADESRAALHKSKPLVQKYLETADRLVKAARPDPAAAEQMVPALQAAF